MLAAGIGAAIAAVLVTPLHHRIAHWAEGRFQGGLVALRRGLPVLASDLRETATPAELADAVLSQVEKGVRATHGAVIAFGKIVDARNIERATVEAWLVDQGAATADLGTLVGDRDDLIFPMRVRLHASHFGPVGWILLGPRPDGSFYGKDEREALHGVAEPIARALAVAAAREQQELSRNHEMDTLRQSISRMQESLNQLFGKQVTSV